MSQVDEFHYCVGIVRGLTCALPFSVADCPHCTEADYTPTPVEALAEAERKLATIRLLAESWAVDDDTYLHMESCQDLGYADAAVQILAVLGVAQETQQ